MDITEKLSILTAGARYDAACTSSGASKSSDNSGAGIGSTLQAGCCHAFAADGRCVTLLKVLMTNHCIYDCKYCINRKSNDVKRASFTPFELADLTIQFYRRNYIEGLFLSSGVLKSPDYTMERMVTTLEIIRYTHNFHGYIHAKTIPGASEGLIRQLGYLADRISVNVELPSEESLNALAPNKSRKAIFTPMAQIASQTNQIDKIGNTEIISSNSAGKRGFAAAGQATQIIIGATPESDYKIIKLSAALYGKYRLKRVFYSAYIPAVEDSLLPALNSKPPLLREHRLYQADWLMRMYEFSADEILSEENPDLNPYLDPKCNWAVNHIHYFPVNVNKASLAELLRVPGIGPTSARRIVAARRNGALRMDELKRMGVVLKRARYFIETADNAYSEAPWCKANKELTARALIDPSAFYFGYEQLSLFSTETAMLPNYGGAEKRVAEAVEETVYNLTKKIGYA
ncbi:MAG: putative DNA modification/repair radical SAM protein [Oscillospiraceae bacterium]|nr:putative DNA modification/repair radical SAM protein [Oscillospiraceae bacterium]